MSKTKPLVLLGIVLLASGCAATVSNKPVHYIELPQLADNAARPKVSLQVFGYKKTDDRLAEQDVAMAARMSKRITTSAQQLDLFEKVIVDPFFRREAEYHIRIDVREGDKSLSTLSAIASGMTFSIVPTTSSTHYSVSLSIKDAQGNVISRGSNSHKEWLAVGLLVLPLHASELSSRRWAYDNAEQYLSYSILEKIMLSGIFAPAPQAPESYDNSNDKNNDKAKQP